MHYYLNIEKVCATEKNRIPQFEVIWHSLTSTGDGCGGNMWVWAGVMSLMFVCFVDVYVIQNHLLSVYVYIVRNI